VLPPALFSLDNAAADDHDAENPNDKGNLEGYKIQPEDEANSALFDDEDRWISQSVFSFCQTNSCNSFLLSSSQLFLSTISAKSAALLKLLIKASF